MIMNSNPDPVGRLNSDAKLVYGMVRPCVSRIFDSSVFFVCIVVDFRPIFLVFYPNIYFYRHVFRCVVEVVLSGFRMFLGVLLPLVRPVLSVMCCQSM